MIYRATVISDAIEYIQELGRTVEELTLLVEKKRRRMELQGDVVDAVVPAAAAVGEAAESSEGEVQAPPAPAAVQQRQPIRSTYIQRRSKDTSVDVRIVEDDVNIKSSSPSAGGMGASQPHRARWTIYALTSSTSPAARSATATSTCSTPR